MKLRKKTVGLALASGGARGGAHVGVLKKLIEEGIKIDEVSGSSIGAVVGAYYCSGNFRKLLEYIEKYNTKNFIWLLDPKFRGSNGLFQGNRIMNLLRKDLGDIKFEDLNVKLKIIATDFITGKAVVFEKGPIVPAIRASISIPFLFEPFEYDGKILVDGGVVVPLPLEYLNTDVKIGVSLSYLDPNENIKGRLRIIQRTLVIMERVIIEEKFYNNPEYIIINPKIAAGHPFDFDVLKKGFEVGYEEMSKNMKLLKKRISNVEKI
ncbi:MAG: patatin-like phospholipase family protein [Candidatus Woesearchaeota archaeon]